MRKISYFIYSYFPVGQAYITLALAICTLIECVVLHPLQQVVYYINFLGWTIFGRPGPILAVKIGPARPLLDSGQNFRYRTIACVFKL